MDWKSVGKTIAGVAPILGTLIGGPIGGAAGTAIKLLTSALGVEGDPTPDAIHEAIKANPEALARVRIAELDNQVALQQLLVESQRLEVQKETSALAQVNETMRSESKSEHWPQYSWRPFNGFSFGITMFGVYFILPLIGKTAPEIPYLVWMAWASVLGVATWHRGKEKRAGAEAETGNLISKISGMIKAVSK